MFKTLFLLVLALVSCKALTDEELALFFNDGCGGGILSIERSGDSILLSTNGRPDHKWQLCNPNIVGNTVHDIVLPNDPQIADVPYCISEGPVGWATNGVAIYNPFAAGQLNAVDGNNQETFDICDGHPTPVDEYHYHRLPMSCIYVDGTQTEQFVGVARDGFPIYGPYQADLGRDAVNADLDECHGRIVGGTYRYVFSKRGEENFPYVMGCYRGEPIDSTGDVGPIPRLTCDTCTNGDSPCTGINQACTCIRLMGPPPPGYEVDLLSYADTTDDGEGTLTNCVDDDASATCRDPHDATPDSLDLEVLKTLDAK